MDSSGDDDDDDDENPANLSSSNEVYIVLTCPFNSMQYFIYFFLIFRPLSTARSKNSEENSANQLVNRIHFLN